METFICSSSADLPDWLCGPSREYALSLLEDEDYGISTIVVARRADGAYQVIGEDHLDAEVISDLLLWAAGR